MRNRRSAMCNMSILERKCTNKAVRLRSMMENQLSTGMTSLDMWDKTLSFFTVKKAFIFHNGYTRSSRDAMRLLRCPEDDVEPLCSQSHLEKLKLR